LCSAITQALISIEGHETQKREAWEKVLWSLENEVKIPDAIQSIGPDTGCFPGVRLAYPSSPHFPSKLHYCL
jgi:hypothetical protein